MVFHVAPVNQGQIVTYAYAWSPDGSIWERRTDAAPGGGVSYRVARNPWKGLGTKRAQELDRWVPWNEDAPGWLVKRMVDAPPPRDDA